ncbi:MAG: hypothetical protein HY301_14960, partial [Verrucomicrobia bacterium]|nr:hypothetical protein [Verrucomicrobiota bacterium]
MKTKFSRFGKILVASCSVAWLGAAAEPDSPIPTTVVPATADSSAAVRPAVGTLPANFKPSPKLDEIIRLAQAGVSEDVLLAYIAKAQRDFSPSSEEIIFLHDLGVTDNVITTLIKSKPGATASAPAPAPAPAPQGVAANAAPPALNGVVAQPAPPEGTATVVIQQPAQQVTVNYFYEELQPYGNWVQVSDYGWCWQPTVVVANAGWRPYGDRGRWLWTTSGWYWQSDYSWGWAPFHYGRWYCHPRYSWVWVPETTWGPSWVSWRYSSSHCGWAPLPPAARFNSGIGFTYFGGNVGVGFEFGLSFGHYTYVPANRFCDRNPWVHRVPESHTKVLYQNTTVVNNYVVGNNNTIINHGAGRETIARSVAKPIPTIAVRDVPENLHGHARADRITT